MQTRDAVKESTVSVDSNELAAETAKAQEAYRAGDTEPLKKLVAVHGLHLPGMRWDMANTSYAVQPDGSFRRLNKPVSKQERRRREAEAAKALGVRRCDYDTHHEFLITLKHAAIAEGYLPAIKPADGARERVAA